MTKKIGGSHSTRPSKHQSKKMSGKNPTTQPKTIQTKADTENMEVHHHAHHGGKKNWRSYVWEFLMLFLAVFCGFLAEYQLEHKIERDREKEYIKSLLNDLKTDIRKLDDNILAFRKASVMQDTAIAFLPLLEKGFNQTFYNNFTAFERFPDFIYTDATIQQLKNSGGFRLIRKPKVTDSIMRYDAIVKGALINEAALGDVLTKTDELHLEILDRSLLNQQLQKGVTIEQLEDQKFTYLITKDRAVLSRYANQLWYFKRLCAIVMTNMINVKAAAERLMIFLVSEYDLE
jgi:hypothetical protein